VKLLDTDTCVEILRGNAAVIERRLAVVDAVVTTWITAAELYYGAAKSRNREHDTDKVTALLATLQVLELDRAAARAFGDTKALLEQQGQRLDDADLLIAAVALAQSATVVTGNRRHYERIPGLVVEDWIQRKPKP